MAGRWRRVRQGTFSAYTLPMTCSLLPLWLRGLPSAAAILLTLTTALGAMPTLAAAAADDLTVLLRKGPVARVEFTAAGKFSGVTSVVDVDVDAAILWSALIDFEHYRFFMARVEEANLRREGERLFVDWEIATPLVATRYTNEVWLDAEKRFMRATTIKGDMTGSRYDWRVESRGPGKSRLIHGAWPRDYAAIVHTLDDDQQTLTIGVAVGSVLATTRAFAERARQLVLSSPAPALPPAPAPAPAPVPVPVP